MKFRCMKACSSDGQDLSELKFPLYATPKIDGIRCTVLHRRAMSSRMKPIPNGFIQATVGIKAFNGFDGELKVGRTFQDSSSGIMSRDGQPQFTFYVFDIWDDESTYLERMGALRAWTHHRPPFIRLLLPVRVNSLVELQSYLALCLDAGFEGIVVRNDGPYKLGRSTWREQYAIKFKPFADAEATIIGFEEQMENRNEARTNELGLQRRSSHKANLVPKGILGKFLVRAAPWGEFAVGTGEGITMELRRTIWFHRKKYLGQKLKFKYQLEGTKDKPRIPIALGVRHPHDL